MVRGSRWFDKTSTWCIICWAALILCLVPMFAIMPFDHPAADDYSFGKFVHQALENGEGLVGVVSAMVYTAYFYYIHWQGTFAAILLFAVQPGVFGIQLYWIAPVILILTYLLSLFYFVRTSVVTCMGAEPRIADIIFCALALLSTQTLPSASQGFYWWNGAVFYTFFTALFLVQVSLEIKLFRDFRVGRLVGCCLLAFFIGGGNFITALWSVGLAAALFAFKTVRGGIKKSWSFSLPFVLALVALAISAAAPGNAVRKDCFTGVSYSALKAIVASFQCATDTAGTFTSPIVLIALVFLFPFLMKLPAVGKGMERRRFLVGTAALWVLLVGLFVASFAPTLYGMGGYGDGRVHNARYFEFLILMVATEAILCQLLMLHLSDGQIESMGRQKAPCLIGGFLALVCVASMIYPGRADALTSISALRSLVKGEAASYARVNASNDALLEASNGGSLELEPLEGSPSTLCYTWYSTDAGGYQNTVVAEYYGLDAVTVREQVDNGAN